MKNISYLLFLFAFSACIPAEDSTYPEEVTLPTPPPIEENRRNICDFDLSEKEGEYELAGKWEFAGFQDIQTGKMDNLTCLARIADFALSGEDYDNLFKVILNLSQVGGHCNETVSFEAISFGSHFQGCYQADGEFITFVISESDIRSIPSSASTTFPVQGFEIRFLEDLRTARNFQIAKNKLYLYGEKEEERIVFVALDE
ncbi:hypothetical protein [Lunatibacter salilacus]|uniref:hypothetical protein n=1 Tax=Lunatibacter salilacus TaxID=2483804 RepID=UPI00131B9194|nr:hypothetical protein [Lunatibacter salilacus]